MNQLLVNKLKALQSASEFECWYLVKHSTNFAHLCYLVSFLKDYIDNPGASRNIETHINNKVAGINSAKPTLGLSNNYRALRVAAFFGLIKMTSSKYEECQFTDTYYEVAKRCNGEFEKTDLYQDIITRQIEKMYVSSSIDEGNSTTRKDYSIYPIMFLNKILIEIGKVTGSYSISMDEYRYLVATTKTYNEYLDTMIYIKLLRAEGAEIYQDNISILDAFKALRGKFDNRMNKAIELLDYIDNSNDSFSIKTECIDLVAKKVYDFEKTQHEMTDSEYISFLCSTNSLFGNNTEDETNTSITELPNDNNDFLQHSLFGIHMTGTNDALSTDNPHISIGWSDMGDLSPISTFEDLTNKYDETWPDVDASKKSQDLTQIWSFYHEAQPGDYVVYSSGALCHIGRIVDGYYYDANERPEQDPDYKNCHKVEWIKLNIAKSDIPKTLRNALMAQRSFWRMDKHKYAVLDLLQDDDSATEETTQTDSNEQEKLYKEWLKKQTKPDGGKYSDNTIYAYIRQMKRGYDAFGKYNGYTSVFQITQTSELDEYMEQLFNETGFSEFNENNGNQACKYGLMKYREYLDELESYEPEPDESVRLKVGRNIILYGVPGAGKSWTIKNDYCKTEDKIERLVFHPDYTYSDFVGQILPKVKDNGGVSYEFTPGPFTTLVRKAYRDPQNEYFLVIEEVNRGNAPAIFGDIFQLLDRNKSGGSEYEITNPDIAKVIYKNSEHKVSIPSNMSILCTMNTSDQNVFTLDTAFQRRWSMRLIKNEFSKEPDEVKFAETLILDTDVTWQKFFTEINDLILKKNIRMTSSEDKRLGTHFVAIEDLRYDDYAGDDANKKREAIQQNKRFAEKVLKYLWDDAFKFNKDEIFDISKVNSLEKVIDVFVGAQGNARFAGIFKENIVSALIPSKQGG